MRLKQIFDIIIKLKTIFQDKDGCGDFNSRFSITYINPHSESTLGL